MRPCRDICLSIGRPVYVLEKWFIFAFFFDEKLCPQCCGFSISQACFRQVRNNQATSNALSQKHKYKSCKNQLLKHVWSILNSCHFKRRVPLEKKSKWINVVWLFWLAIHIQNWPLPLRSKFYEREKKTFRIHKQAYQYLKQMSRQGLIPTFRTHF